MATCKDCLHVEVCALKNEQVSLGTKVKDLNHECVHFKDLTKYVEQKHGGWKLHKNGSGTCDRCGGSAKNIWDYDGWQNYCGRCGAKMDLIGKPLPIHHGDHGGATEEEAYNMLGVNKK